MKHSHSFLTYYVKQILTRLNDFGNLGVGKKKFHCHRVNFKLMLTRKPRDSKEFLIMARSVAASLAELAMIKKSSM